MDKEIGMIILYMLYTLYMFYTFTSGDDVKIVTGSDLFRCAGHYKGCFKRYQWSSGLCEQHYFNIPDFIELFVTKFILVNYVIKTLCKR